MHAGIVFDQKPAFGFSHPNTNRTTRRWSHQCISENGLDKLIIVRLRKNKYNRSSTIWRMFSGSMKTIYTSSLLSLFYKITTAHQRWLIQHQTASYKTPHRPLSNGKQCNSNAVFTHFRAAANFQFIWKPVYTSGYIFVRPLVNCAERKMKRSVHEVLFHPGLLIVFSCWRRVGALNSVKALRSNPQNVFRVLENSFPTMLIMRRAICSHSFARDLLET